jgi:hypothetical protein
MSNRNALNQFLNGDLTVNEFTVYVAVSALADQYSTRTLSTTTPQLVSRLGNSLSRHAVARSLRNLQNKEMINWNTNTGSRYSQIEVI